ncbi:hypothetical protein ONZ43_g1811 [Nemania bipapillata]|uniref:Uncharacterized protein n=1 Tax=Nemania bipapillata TaxID=110536 RepID=A0ACC2J375_9PEZI|nr:hypothetical protein ONZ43_g1811 [Nemania bipapillata]
MAVEIVTIVNSSGKIISNGKHLVNAFKEAKAAYDEKKAAVRAERAVRRAQTYDASTTPNYVNGHGQDGYEYRYANDDGVSQTSSPLTEGNLRTHSEVSSVTPSRPPAAYRSPYAETAPRDMALSRPMLAPAPTMPTTTDVMAPVPMENLYMQRSISDPALQESGKKKKEIDMDLAYGNIPPDLESRVDLDPAYKAVEKEHKARKHLQGKPEAAAAVALTLAELQKLPFRAPTTPIPSPTSAKGKGRAYSGWMMSDELSESNLSSIALGLSRNTLSSRSVVAASILPTSNEWIFCY